MNVLAKRILVENALPQIHRTRPFLLLLRHTRQGFEHPQVLLTIVRALFLDPGVVAALHKLAAIEPDRLFVAANAKIKVTFATGGFAICNQLIDLFSIDAVREFRIELIIAIAIDDKILLERLIAV